MAGARNGDIVLLSQVIERDGTNCAGCGLAVDLTLKHPHRMSKSLDHVVPISKGGTHTLDNAALMHFACNASKGNRTPLPPVPPPGTTEALRVYGPYILDVFSTGR
jgi:5-methylcytosine-specific restriction endonuclease McrA